jgi:RNA polymerase sigma-70 factor, ECF subfamily
MRRETIVVVPANPDRLQTFTDDLQRCQAQLTRYIFALVRNVEDAQDVFQQTCMVLWHKFEQFDPDQSGFLAWACGVARFEAYNFLKHHRRYRARFSDEFARRLAEFQVSSPSDTIEARRAALPGCIDKLSPSQRELLMLCYGEDQRVADVAAKLGRPTCGVHNSLRTIRAKLMECIERAVRGEDR